MKLLITAGQYLCYPLSLRSVSSQSVNRVYNTSDCLTEHQNGNKKKHSTETLHIFMSDTILEAMDQKQVTALVLLDLSKAFDSIEHGIL